MPRNRPRNSGYERTNKDFEPRWVVVHLLLDTESIGGEVLDLCRGSGAIPSLCQERGVPARGSDIVDRGFGEIRDLFTITEPVDTIISNIDYKIAEKCARHMFRLVRRNLILALTFLESRERENFFREHPPIRVGARSNRSSMPPGCMEGERDRFGAIIQPVNSGGTMRYGWFIWELGYRGEITLRRLPPMP
jgi:hypothetical protein